METILSRTGMAGIAKQPHLEVPKDWKIIQDVGKKKETGQGSRHTALPGLRFERRLFRRGSANYTDQIFDQEGKYRGVESIQPASGISIDNTDIISCPDRIGIRLQEPLRMEEGHPVGTLKGRPRWTAFIGILSKSPRARAQPKALRWIRKAPSTAAEVGPKDLKKYVKK